MPAAARLFAIRRFPIAVNTIKNLILSAGDPFKQSHGVGFEQSSLAELSPLGISYCSRCSCASAMLIASEVRPQFGQKRSLVAGFHLMTGCFMGLRGCHFACCRTAA